MEAIKNKKMWIVLVPMVFAGVSYFAGFDVGKEVQSIVCDPVPVCQACPVLSCPPSAENVGP